MQTYSIRQTAWTPTPTPVALGARASDPRRANILDTADSLGAYPDTSCPECAGLRPALHSACQKPEARVRGPEARVGQTYSIRQTAWAPTPTPVALGARASGPRRAGMAETHRLAHQHSITLPSPPQAGCEVKAHLPYLTR